MTIPLFFPNTLFILFHYYLCTAALALYYNYPLFICQPSERRHLCIFFIYKIYIDIVKKKHERVKGSGAYFVVFHIHLVYLVYQHEYSAARIHL
jgi:hypothetical protein